MEKIEKTEKTAGIRQDTLDMLEENEADKPKDGETVAYRKELEYDEVTDDDDNQSISESESNNELFSE